MNNSMATKVPLTDGGNDSKSVHHQIIRPVLPLPKLPPNHQSNLWSNLVPAAAPAARNLQDDINNPRKDGGDLMNILRKPWHMSWRQPHPLPHHAGHGRQENPFYNTTTIGKCPSKVLEDLREDFRKRKEEDLMPATLPAKETVLNPDLHEITAEFRRDPVRSGVNVMEIPSDSIYSYKGRPRLQYEKEFDRADELKKKLNDVSAKLQEKQDWSACEMFKAPNLLPQDSDTVINFDESAMPLPPTRKPTTRKSKKPSNVGLSRSTQMTLAKLRRNVKASLQARKKKYAMNDETDEEEHAEVYPSCSGGESLEEVERELAAVNQKLAALENYALNSECDRHHNNDEHEHKEDVESSYSSCSWNSLELELAGLTLSDKNLSKVNVVRHEPCGYSISSASADDSK